MQDQTVGELFQSDQCVQVYAAGRDGIEVGEEQEPSSDPELLDHDTGKSGFSSRALSLNEVPREQELVKTATDPVGVSRCPGAGDPPVLSLELVPVVVPLRETGFQATSERYHGRWQAEVWQRFHHESWPALQDQSDRYVGAYHYRAAAQLEGVPPRRPFPMPWRLSLRAPVHGGLIFLRRMTTQGEVTVLGHRFIVDATWPHRLVRAEVDVDQEIIHFSAQRRREPMAQPRLRTIPYPLPHRRFGVSGRF